MYEHPPGFAGRWSLTGTLTTESPLHIGDGERLPVRQRDSVGVSDFPAETEFATVFTGYRGRPFIPATSLKGSLSAWAAAHGFDPQSLFGSAQNGGAVTVEDAFLLDCPAPADKQFRHWSDARQTLLNPSVVIDPHSRAAAEKLLYYEEYVPAGARFQVVISGQNTPESARALLLHLLQHAFSSPVRPARLGSGCANGWGRVAWSLDRVEVLSPADLSAWLQNSQPVHWRQNLRTLTPDETKAWCGLTVPVAAPSAVAELRLHLKLFFDGAMLVNDPTRQRKGAEDPVSHHRLLDEAGQPLLPASSLRGAFRAHAARIWRTLRSGDPAPAFARLFGATSWRSPLGFEDFRLVGQAQVHDQEFVAIDRFTAGSAPERKFRALGLWRPVFHGHLTLALHRWNQGAPEPWVWLLLAFVLRDWTEGEGLVGLGASKGYGAFRANVTFPDGPVCPAAEILGTLLSRDPAALSSPLLDEWEKSLRTALEAA